MTLPTLLRTSYVPAANPIERRTSTRVALEVEVEVSALSESNFFAGFVEDVSHGGLFIATHRTLTVGQLLVVQLSLPGVDRQYSVLCEVRWLRRPRGSDASPGAGVRFIDMDPGLRGLVARFVAKRAPIFHEE